MEEIFKVFEPATVKGLMEDLFTGYINSEMCTLENLGQIYELKRMVNAEADKKLISVSHGHARN